MIVDCCIFFNELDQLAIRLQELSPIVDLFVIVECGEAFSGRRKPFFFEENADRYSEYLSRIVHIKLAGLPPLIEDTEDRRFWLEKYQRDCLVQGTLGRGLSLDDLILISDVDEIPRLSAVQQAYDERLNYDVAIFKQSYYKFFFDYNTAANRQNRPWLGPVAVKFSALGKALPHELRRGWGHAGALFDEDFHSKLDQKIHRLYIDGAGWHLTYFGGKKAEQYKKVNFAHGAGDIYGKTMDVEHSTISRETLAGLKQLTPDLRLKLINIMENDLESNVPSAVVQNLDRYYHLFEKSFEKSP